MILSPIYPVHLPNGSKGKQVDGTLKQMENPAVFRWDIEGKPLVAAVALTLKVRSNSRPRERTTTIIFAEHCGFLMQYAGRRKLFAKAALTLKTFSSIIIYILGK